MLKTDKDTIRADRSALITELEKAGAKFKGNACICPYHEDNTPSAGVFEDDMGVWRFKCQACGTKGDYWDIKARNEGKTLADVFGENSHSKQPATPKVYATIEQAEQTIPGQIEARYAYTNPATNKPELIVLRAVTTDGKTFRQISPANGGFVFKAPPKPWPLYNRGRIQNADTVVVVEGEKCVHALHDHSAVATTSPCGAGKAQHADWTLLAGKNVVLWPDNDEAGRKHMADVEKILQNLEPAPRISVLEPTELDLDEKEDAADFVEQLQNASCSKAEIQQELQDTLSKAKPKGIAAEVGNHIEAAISGLIMAVEFPWGYLSQCSKALLPETVTLLCGSAGASKSFMLLQTLAYWHDGGIKTACFQLEEDRKFHLTRMLAQKSGLAGITDPDWVKTNGDQARQAYTDHQAFLDGFGSRMWAAPETEQTLDQIAHWVTDRAKSGCRVIAIDPITAAAQSPKPWIQDASFLGKIKRIAGDYGCSVVLVTHPAKSFSGPDMNQLAGGAAYSRFSQSILWLETHEPKTSRIKGAVGTADCEHNRTVRILKARNARGTGFRLAFQFSSESLTLNELGVIIKDSRK